MEQIYKWNPDVILITTMTETIAEDILNNSIEGQDWSQIEAVKNGKVFKEPLGVFHWFPPSGDAPLMANWMAQTLHLDLFIYSMSDEIKLYYENFCGYKLTQEQIEGILTSNTEAGKGAFFGDSK